MQRRAESAHGDAYVHILGGAVNLLQGGQVLPYHFGYGIHRLFRYVIAGHQHIGGGHRANRFVLIGIDARRELIPVPKRITGVDLVKRLLGPVENRHPLPHQRVSPGDGRHRRPRRNVHPDDVAVLNGRSGGAVTHISQGEFVFVVDTQRLQNETPGALGPGVARPQHITLAVQIIQIVDEPGLRQFREQHEMLHILPKGADAAKMFLRPAHRPLTAPRPGPELPLQNGELGLIVPQQFDVLQRPGGTDGRKRNPLTLRQFRMRDGGQRHPHRIKSAAGGGRGQHIRPRPPQLIPATLQQRQQHTHRSLGGDAADDGPGGAPMAVSARMTGDCLHIICLARLQASGRGDSVSTIIEHWQRHQSA